MKIWIVFSLALLFGCKSGTSTSNVSLSDYEKYILLDTDKTVVSAAEMKSIVRYLASDELKGRNTGTAGITESANFIEAYFKKYGIGPYFESYRDEFPFEASTGFNMVGFLEGTDPKLKSEIVMLGAHYDHIGEIEPVNGDAIANGANDNAAGTAVVLEMAKYFAHTKTNKRSMMFVLFAAEEHGLLGSKHLAKRLADKGTNLHTMLNFEMIGVPLKDKDYVAYISGYERSNLAVKMNEYAGKKLVGFLPRAKQMKLFYRSDNYPIFEVFKIPAQTFCTFDFTNFEYYHHVDDEVDKLDFNHMANFANSYLPAIEKVVNSQPNEIRLHE